MIKISSFATLSIFVILALLAASTDASVLGIDFGTEYIKVSTIKNGVIDIVLNEQSKRKTAAVVGFRDDERLFSDSGAQLATKVPQQTFQHMKHLLGKTYSKEVQDYLDSLKLPFQIAEDAERGTFELKLQNGQSFSPEALSAMVLQYVADFAAKEAGAPIKDCVIAVPAFFTQQQRKAIRDAAAIAGLNVLGLVNEHTATAVQYALGKNKYDAKPYTVVFYDMGHGATQVSVIQFTAPEDNKDKKNLGKIEVKSVAWDSTLGGSAFDVCLSNVFAEDFVKQHPSVGDPRSSPRAFAKIRKEARRIKEILSANSETPVIMEGLYEDRDLRSFITRKDFEEKCGHLFARAALPIRQALKDAEITAEAVNSVELMGGNSRIPYIQKVIMTELGRDDVNKSLNSDEAITLGATFYAAGLNPRMRVPKFTISDINPYAISFTLSDEESKVPRILFPARSRLNSKKAISLARTNDFSVSIQTAMPSEPVALPFGSVLEISEHNVTGVAEAFKKHEDRKTANNVDAPSDINLEKPKLKVHFRLDDNGIVHLDSANVAFEELVWVPVATPAPKVDKKKAEAATATDDKDKTSAEESNKEQSDEKPTTENTNTTSDDENSDESEAPETPETSTSTSTTDSTAKDTAAAAAPAKKASKRVHKASLKHSKSESGVKNLDNSAIQKSVRILSELREKDIMRQRIAAARNDLETYIYNTRDKLDVDESIAQVSTSKEREVLLSEISQADDWLSDDGYDASLAQYEEKLSGLRKLSDAIFRRARELEERPRQFQACRDHLNLTRRVVLDKWNVSMPHSNETERTDLVNTIEETERWINEKEAAQAKKPLTENPVIYSEEIDEYCKLVARKAYILTQKPAPRPSPKPRAPKKEAKAESEKEKAKESSSKKTEKSAEADSKEESAEKPQRDEL